MLYIRKRLGSALVMSPEMNVQQKRSGLGLQNTSIQAALEFVMSGFLSNNF